MSAVVPREEFSEQEATYITEVDGRVIIVERVPARVSLTTGERLYSPETVERIQANIWGQSPQARTVSPQSTSFPSPARPDGRFVRNESDVWAEPFSRRGLKGARA